MRAAVIPNRPRVQLTGRPRLGAGARPPLLGRVTGKPQLGAGAGVLGTRPVGQVVGQPSFGAGARPPKRGGKKPGPPSNKTPAPNPEATPTPTGAPPPPDPVYDAAMQAALSQRQTTEANLAGQRTAGLIDYGYNESGPIDPLTGHGALQFDPNNPFSKAAQLKRNYDISRRSTGYSSATSGGLYSGGYQTGQNAENYNQLKDQDELQKSLYAFLAQNYGDTAQAGVDYTTAGSTAYGDMMGRIRTNPLYEPTAGTTPGSGKGGKPGGKGGKGGGKGGGKPSATVVGTPQFGAGAKTVGSTGRATTGHPQFGAGVQALTRPARKKSHKPRR